MNLGSIIVGFYMLVIGGVLIVSSTLYRLRLDEIERIHGLSCPRKLVSSNYRVKEGLQHAGLPSCPNLTLWKTFAEAGIVSGSSYILFILSQIVAVTCCRCRRGSRTKDDNEDDFATSKSSKCACCCSNWMFGVTTFLGLSIVSLALTFIFLGSKQLESIQPLDEERDKGILDFYPPVILYVFSIWHFVTLCGFCVWLGIVIFCPSIPKLSTRQCDEV